MYCADVSLEGQAWMSRQLQVGLVGGSVATVGWRILEEVAKLSASGSPLPLVLECPLPELCDCVSELSSQVHWPSLLLGCLIGLCLGPLIDTLYCLRVVFVRPFVPACAQAASASLPHPFMNQAFSSQNVLLVLSEFCLQCARSAFLLALRWPPARVLQCARSPGFSLRCARSSRASASVSQHRRFLCSSPLRRSSWP